MLSTYVPDLEVALIEVDQADVLPDRRDCVQARIVIRIVQALDLLEQSGFASVVKSEEEDGVFCEATIVSLLRLSVA